MMTNANLDENIRPLSQLHTVELKNDRLRVAVSPRLGGRLEQITDLQTGKDWLWHPTSFGHLKGERKFGASFDESWTGGWEECFPNDAALSLHGRSLVDHGELWSQPWRVVEYEEHGVQLALSCQTTPVDVEKTFVLNSESASLAITYRLKNRSSDRVPFHLKLHPALAIEEGDEFLLPSCIAEPVDHGFSKLIGRMGASRFPFAKAEDGQDIRIDRVLSRDSGLREFFYCSELSEGQCGLYNRRTGRTFAIDFDLRQFPYVWVFQSYGGFMGHYVAMIEPCTSKHWDLEKAQQSGHCAYLEPNETQEFHVEVSVRS